MFLSDIAKKLDLNETLTKEEEKFTIKAFSTLMSLPKVELDKPELLWVSQVRAYAKCINQYLSLKEAITLVHWWMEKD